MNHSQTGREDARNVRAHAFVAQMHKAERAELARVIEQHEVAELERAAIAARIKQARNEAGLSQPEMADALGVIPRTYQNYESQKDPRTPWGLMNQIATITGKTTEWLIHGDRATPDLFPVTEQLDGVSSEFAGRVDQVEAKLDDIDDKLDQLQQALGDASVERVGLVDQILALLKQQGELLDRQTELIASLQSAAERLPDGPTIQEHLGQQLRDVLVRTAPPPES